MSATEDSVELAVEVVLFHASGGERVIPVGGGVSVMLRGSNPPATDVLSSLLEATVLLAAPDVPDDLIDAIAETPTPALFRQSPELYQHKALVFVDGQCEVDHYVLRYHEKRGILIDADS